MNRLNPGRYVSTAGLVWLGLLLILVFNFSIRWRLRDLPLERDEGEYAYAGQLIQEGIPPYQLAWNMKFPGVYYAYAGLMSVFGETSQGIHEGLILVTTLSGWLIFLIGRRLLGAAGGLVAAALFSLMSALPEAFGLAAHATHFVVLLVCLGTWLLLVAAAEKQRSRVWIFLAGAALGGAILMKQHALFFVPAMAGWQFWQARQRSERGLAGITLFLTGTAAPPVLMAAVMAEAGVWNRFVYWTIQYARDYVSIFPLQAVPRQFTAGFGPLFDSGIWVWPAGLAGLSLLFFRGRFRVAAAAGAGLFLTGLAAAVPGYYFRGHYFLMAMPGLALLNAVWLAAVAEKLKKTPGRRALGLLPAGLLVIITGDLLVRNAEMWFRLPAAEVTSRIYGASPFPASPGIAGYLAAHTGPADTIAVLGSEPQLFFLAHRHSATGYIYVYPLTEPQPLAPAMRQEFFKEIEQARPAYVVYVNTLSSWCSAVIPGDTAKVLDSFQNWWVDYSKNYQLAGLVDYAANKPADFYWDGQMAGRTNPAPANILIYRRN